MSCVFCAVAPLQCAALLDWGLFILEIVRLKSAVLSLSGGGFKST